MGRGQWPADEAAEFQYRIKHVINERFGGSIPRFREACELEQSTVSKWLYTGSTRVPDSLSLKRIAEKAGVCLDWLVLARPATEMPWPPVTMEAKAQLFEAVVARMERSYADDETMYAPR